VHALALILSEVLTDSQPFDAEEVMILMAQILGRERPTPARRGVDAGPWEAILEKALALRPESRFRDAGEFLAALEAAMPAPDATGSMRAAIGGNAASIRPPPVASVPPPARCRRGLARAPRSRRPPWQKQRPSRPRPPRCRARPRRAAASG
jgi:hypothetical protein